MISVGTPVLCIFKKDLPEVIKLGKPRKFATDLKILVVGEKREEVHDELNSFERWVAEKNGLCTRQI